VGEHGNLLGAPAAAYADAAPLEPWVTAHHVDYSRVRPVPYADYFSVSAEAYPAGGDAHVLGAARAMQRVDDAREDCADDRWLADTESPDGRCRPCGLSVRVI
jgi:hypothetical protein